MDNNLFSNVFAQSQPVLDIVNKFNKLAIAELEKLVALQTTTAASCIDFCMGQLKAASDVNDPQSLQLFYTSQSKALNALRQKLTEDSQALAKLSADLSSELSKLVQESVADLIPKAAKAEVREAA